MTDHQTSAVLTLTRRLRARFKETDFTIQGSRHRDETHVDIQWGEGPPVDVVTTICSEELADDTVQLSFMRWQTCPACGYVTARPDVGGLYCGVCERTTGKQFSPSSSNRR